MSELLNAALSYAARGWPVFPLHYPVDGHCSCGDPACDSPAKHPLGPAAPRGLSDATTDETKIRAWWSSRPQANIGLVCTAESGLIAADLDGAEAKDAFKARFPRLDFESIPRQRTGRPEGGWHLVFSHPGTTVRGKIAGLPRVDIKSNGYILAEPSVHISGRPYRWEKPLVTPLPKLPLELFQAITSPAVSGENGYRDRFDTAKALAGVPEGQRDETLFRLACKLRAADVPQDMAETLILEAARNCEPPFPEREALEKIRNAYRRYEPSKGEDKAAPSRHFSLIDAKDLLSLEEPETEWLWEGILPAGGLSLLVAKPKVGKTTLAFNLALAVASGRDFLGRKTKQSPVIYLALEEKRSEIRKKLKALRETPEGLSFHFGSAPEKAIQEVKTLIHETKAGFLVVDVLQKLCRVKDLNDYAQVTNTLEPLMATAREENCHILLTHHAGKADRQDGDDILGSTALLGGVDTSIHIKKREKRRSFFTIQRYGEDTPETVIELRPDGSLASLGDRQTVEIKETVPLVWEVLSGEPMQEKEIWARVEKDHSKVSKALRLLVEEGMADRIGSGKRNDPYGYQKNALLLSCTTYEESKREIETAKKPLQLKEECSLEKIDKKSLNDESPRELFSTPKEALAGRKPWMQEV